MTIVYGVLEGRLRTPLYAEGVTTSVYGVREGRVRTPLNTEGVTSVYGVRKDE